MSLIKVTPPYPLHLTPTPQEIFQFAKCIEKEDCLPVSSSPSLWPRKAFGTVGLVSHSLPGSLSQSAGEGGSSTGPKGQTLRTRQSGVPSPPP